MKTTYTIFLALLLSSLPLMGQARSEITNLPIKRTVITSDKQTLTNSGNHAEFVCTGNVKLTGTNIEITCDRLVAISSREASDEMSIGDIGGIESLVATGNVRIVQLGRMATAGRVEVFPKEDKIVLTENNPIIRDAQSSASGTKITMYRGQGQVEIENAVLIGPTLPDMGFKEEVPELNEEQKSLAIEEDKTPALEEPASSEETEVETEETKN